MRYRLRDVKVVDAEPRDEVFRFTCPACAAVVQVKATRQITIRGERRRIPVTLKNTDASLRKAKGGLKDKKIRTYLAETRNACVYCGAAIDRSTVQIDHIFPEANSGPGIDSNLVASCLSCNQKRKGKQTPWRWKGEADKQWWQEFEKRVRKLPLPLRKQRILLSAEDIYPENPTALARAGARPRAFIEELKTMLERHGVRRDQIADNYEEGKLVIQAIDGWMTSQLRRSWLANQDGTPNFPEKNVWDLRNHAQDAALIAACPPHTWRERIFAFGAYRDQAPSELAPNWAEFTLRHYQKKPIVTVLGNYDLRWRAKFANEQFWRNPSSWQNGQDERMEPVKGALLKNITAKQADRIKSEGIKQHFLAVAEKYGRRDKATLSEPALAELQARLKERDNTGIKITEKDVRRVQRYTDKGGKPFVIRPQDGPPRVTEAHPATEGVIIWLKPGKTFENAKSDDLVFSLIRPGPLVRLGVLGKEEPKLEEGALRLKVWKRHDFVRLVGKGKHPEGWYRTKEFYDDKVIALPEEAIPTDLADRMRLKSDESVGKVSDKERNLGKKELLDYFKRGLL